MTTRDRTASRLTHQDDQGRPQMVDVGAKPETHRSAVAEGTISMLPETLTALREHRLPKGDPLLIAQIAGIQGAKRTADLVPLCHPIALDAVTVELDIDPALPGVHARASAEVRGRTGVEMEALTAVSIALLTLYDMLKSIDRGMRIDGIRLLHKSGGRSCTWQRVDHPERSNDSP